MYELLADTYNLDADEREVLGMLGRETGLQNVGTDQWVVSVIGGDAMGIWESLAVKLEAAGDGQKLADMAEWYASGQCPVVMHDPPEVAICPPGIGCRRTMSIGLFPFWPIESRCADCIREAVMPSRGIEKQRIVGSKLRDLLKAGGAEHANVPHITTVIGGLVTELGGTDSIVREWGQLINDENVRPAERLKQYKVIANFIAACNQMQQDQLSELDKFSDGQLGVFIKNLLLQNATKEQLRAIFESVEDLPRSDVARLDYGQA